MLRKFYIFLIISIVFVFSSCKCATEYNFFHEKEMIASIELVKAYYDFEKEEPIQEAIQTIENKEEFIKDFKSLKCYIYLRAPMGVDEKGLAIKIMYSNGDYELIRHIGQAEYTYGKGYNGYCTNGNFDKEEFNKLIYKYSGIDVVAYNEALKKTGN